MIKKYAILTESGQYRKLEGVKYGVKPPVYLQNTLLLSVNSRNRQ